MTFAARVYFAMARDGFFPAAAGASNLQDPVAFDCRAGRLGDRPDSDRQPRRAGQLRGVRDYVVRGDRGRGGVRAPGTRAERPSAVQGGGIPVDPAIFVLFSFVMVVNAIYRQPRVTGIGLLLIGAGIPLYLWLTRRAKGAR